MRRITGFAMLVAVTAVVAGCGSSSSSSSTAVSSSAAGGGTSSSASASSSSASSASPSFASAQNCQQLAGVGQKFAQAMAASTAGGKFDLQTAAQAYQQLAAAAPSEIQPDLQTLSAAFTNFADSLSKVNYTLGQVPTAAQLGALQSAGQAFTSAKVRAAEQHITSWAKANCSA